MGPMESSNREHTNIQPNYNKTNNNDENKTTNICIKMPEKHKGQRRGRWNARNNREKRRTAKKQKKETTKNENNKVEERKNNIEYREETKNANNNVLHRESEDM